MTDVVRDSPAAAPGNANEVWSPPMFEVATRAIEPLSVELAPERSPLEGLRQLFTEALDSDADLIVVLARRAFILFHILRLAGLLPTSQADLNGRVVSQRAVERDLSILRHKRVLLVDDAYRMGRTAAYYKERFADENPTSLDFRVLVMAENSANKASPESSDEVPQGDEDPKEIALWGQVPDDQIDRFNLACTRAVSLAGVPFFSDFPWYRASRSGTYMLLAVLRDLEWRIVKTGVIDEGDSGAQPEHFICTQPGDATAPGLLPMRMRIVVPPGAGSAYLMPKVALAAESLKRVETGLKGTPESSFRDEMIEASVQGFQHLLGQAGVPALGLLRLTVDTQYVKDHWPRSQWQEALRSLLVVAPQAENDTVPVNRPPLADVETLQVSSDYLENLVGSEEVESILRPGDEPGLTFEQVRSTLSERLGTAVAVHDMLAALDFLADRGFCTAEVRIQKDKEVRRIWRRGENSNSSSHIQKILLTSAEVPDRSPEPASPGENYQPPGVPGVSYMQALSVVDDSGTLWVDQRSWDGEPYGADTDQMKRATAVLRGMLAPSRRDLPAVASWCLRPHRSLAGASPLAAVLAGKVSQVRSLADAEIS